MNALSDRLRPERTDADYLRFDPFGGDRDIDLKCHTSAIVVVRKNHDCYSPFPIPPHKIQAGERARYETALVEGHWGRYYICLVCMDQWLDDTIKRPETQ
mgnify:CR=1 FL=1